jgi:uncharacterized protein (TIGR02001 family)
MTMKKTLIGAASVAALALAATAAPAVAEDREFGWSITLGGTSDYVFRGLSFSNEDPAAQGSIDFSYGIFYAGAWGSNLDGLSGPWELDLYAGVKPVWGPVTFDFGVIGYLYPASSQVLEDEYIELKAGASMELVKNLSGYVTYYYQIENDGLIATVNTFEGGLSYSLPQVGIFEPSISGLVGTSINEDTALADDDYVYWNAGLSLTVEKFTMDFRYWDTDINNGGSVFALPGLDDERFVFTAKVTLP